MGRRFPLVEKGEDFEEISDVVSTHRNPNLVNYSPLGQRVTRGETMTNKRKRDKRK
jgi:hypothetical protein